MNKEPNNNSFDIDIFISHSSKDAEMATALIELLRNALNLPAEKVRCTSVNGYRLPAGASTEERLRQEVHEARIFIGLITKASIQSAYVLFELGARWGAERYLIPLIASGDDASILQGPLSSLNALRCDDAGQVHQLITEVASKLGRPQLNTPAYLKNLDRVVQLSKEQTQIKTHSSPRGSRELAWRRWTIITSLFIVAVFLVLQMWKVSVGQSTAIEITDPRDNAVVNTSEMIKGKSQSIPDDKVIWIIVYSKARYLFIPQEASADIQINGTWQNRASIGSDEPIGSKFEILAVLADKKAQEIFLTNRTQEPGLKSLPEGTVIYSSIKVATQ